MEVSDELAVCLAPPLLPAGCCQDRGHQFSPFASASQFIPLSFSCLLFYLHAASLSHTTHTAAFPSHSHSLINTNCLAGCGLGQSLPGSHSAVPAACPGRSSAVPAAWVRRSSAVPAAWVGRSSAVPATWVGRCNAVPAAWVRRSMAVPAEANSAIPAEDAALHFQHRDAATSLQCGARGTTTPHLRGRYCSPCSPEAS